MKTSKWLALIAALYALSLVSPALANPQGKTIRGVECLIFIPWACLLPSWWANPLLFAGCGYLARGNRRSAWRLGLLATILAAVFGPAFGIKNVRIGYALWLCSMVALTVAGLDGGPGTTRPARVAALDDP